MPGGCMKIHWISWNEIFRENFKFKLLRFSVQYKVRKARRHAQRIEIEYNWISIFPRLFVCSSLPCEFLLDIRFYGIVILCSFEAFQKKTMRWVMRHEYSLERIYIFVDIVIVRVRALPWERHATISILNFAAQFIIILIGQTEWKFWVTRRSTEAAAG